MDDLHVYHQITIGVPIFYKGLIGTLQRRVPLPLNPEPPLPYLKPKDSVKHLKGPNTRAFHIYNQRPYEKKNTNLVIDLTVIKIYHPKSKSNSYILLLFLSLFNHPVP